VRFVVRHHSRYGYDVPVALGAHTLRLSPRDEWIRVQEHRVHVVPEPVERRASVDRFGNRSLELAFRGTSRELRVDSDLVVDTRAPPVLAVSPPALPWAPDRGELGEFLGRASSDPAVRRFAATLAADVAGAPIAFLDHLSQTLFARFEHEVRTSGDALPGAATLATGRGACRDLTVLFIDACRSLGIPSRFASGYQASASWGAVRRDLHAWPEVALPGVGFRGWDPTHGARVGDDHVALCVAPEQAGTMPIQGGYTFEGPSLRSTLDFSLHIDAH